MMPYLWQRLQQKLWEKFTTFTEAEQKWKIIQGRRPKRIQANHLHTGLEHQKIPRPGNCRPPYMMPSWPCLHSSERLQWRSIKRKTIKCQLAPQQAYDHLWRSHLALSLPHKSEHVVHHLAGSSLSCVDLFFFATAQIFKDRTALTTTLKPPEGVSRATLCS